MGPGHQDLDPGAGPLAAPTASINALLAGNGLLTDEALLPTRPLAV